MSRLLCVIRLRGKVGVGKEEEDTLKMLRLHKRNHCVVIKNSPSFIGMLRKVSNHVTYGEINFETLLLLIKKRGRLIGGKPVNDQYARKLGYDKLDELIKDLHALKVKGSKLPNFKPVFRLHPPKGGFKGSVKKQYGAGGELGYRGEAINELVKRMI